MSKKLTDFKNNPLNHIKKLNGFSFLKLTETVEKLTDLVLYNHSTRWGQKMLTGC